MSAGSSTSESRDMRANLLFLYEITESQLIQNGREERKLLYQEKRGFTFAFLP
jgi:hypothetical protein